MIYMSNYAVVKDGFVVNVVVWDGTGDIFADTTTIELTDKVSAFIGDAYLDGGVISKPRDGYEYKFNDKSKAWEMTDESKALIADKDKKKNLTFAQGEYDRASTKLTALEQRIEDDDYDEVNTEKSIASEKTKWTTYRKSLRAYISAGDGTASLPKAPDA